MSGDTRDYQGHNGRISIDGDALVLVHEGMAAKVSGVTGQRWIPLPAISHVEYKPATRLVNGQIRLGIGGVKPVAGVQAAADPMCVLFTHKQREKFEELHTWLLSTIEHYRAAGVDPATVEVDRPTSAKHAKWEERLGTDRPDIVEAAARLGTTLGGKREIKKLPEHLHAGETVRMLAQGTYDGNQGIVALTDQRLLFVFHGVMSQAQEDFPLRAITSVQTKSGFATGDLHVTVAGMRSTISQVNKNDLAPLAEAVRQGMASAQAGPPATPATPAPAPAAPAVADPFEALTKLGQLRDAGVLTPEEFEAKKAEILARM